MPKIDKISDLNKSRICACGWTFCCGSGHHRHYSNHNDVIIKIISVSSSSLSLSLPLSSKSSPCHYHHHSRRELMEAVVVGAFDGWVGKNKWRLQFVLYFCHISFVFLAYFYCICITFVCICITFFCICITFVLYLYHISTIFVSHLYWFCISHILFVLYCVYLYIPCIYICNICIV